ncbi:hypothetical protein [Polaribacter sp.]|uniref:hypothetical protein n=1 Tax=Polaribacter sp. TaxID=1920175 RepID=UPI003F6CC949
MDSNPELTALQNSINHFKIKGEIKLFFDQDKRKKTRFILTKEDISISPPLNYSQMNMYLLGIWHSKKHKL